jgi:acetyl esterase/lipase
MYPVQEQDVAAAIAWTVEHIEEYQGDPNQFS